MLELDARNTLEYLHAQGVLDRSITARVEPLAWGVSNIVLRVIPDRGEDFVLKQSRAQLRTKDPWFSRLDRVWREIEVLRLVSPMLPAGVVPRVLFEDRANYLFTMEAAPADHVVWKQTLLEGHVDPAIAYSLGEYLGTIHRQTANRSDLQQDLGDTEVFVQLRVDPFYRKIASVHPDVQSQISQMVDEMFATAVCLVHADFSPKNVLISEQGITLVDLETAHYGDPAFDLGFFLSHLLLKTVLHSPRCFEFIVLTTRFWEGYFLSLGNLTRSGPFVTSELQRRGIAHLAGCMWARIDGTSPVDYLPEPAQRQFVRDFCRQLLLDPPDNWDGVVERLVSRLGRGN